MVTVTTSLETLFYSFHVAVIEEKQLMYIIHMANSRILTTFAEHGHWYDASLCSVSNSIEILYSYDTITHGFSACFTLAKAQALESLDGILSILLEVTMSSTPLRY